MRAVALTAVAAALLCRHSGLPAPAPGAAPSGQDARLPPEVILLARIRQAAIDNLDRMPNYVCTETVERSARPARGRYTVIDHVALDVAHLEGTELYAWPGEDSFVRKDPSDFVGGASSTGEYAGHLRTIVLSGAATMNYAGEEKVNGVRAAGYDFRVPEFAARMKLRVGNTSGTSGLRGRLWADPKSYDLVRLELHADGIPPHVDLLSGSTGVDYRRVKIGSREVVLPAASEVRLINLSGFEWRNVTTFARCREYLGRSKITFDEDPASAHRRIGPAPAPLVPIQLPYGIEIRAALTARIDLEKTPVGTPVRARVLRTAGEIPQDAVLTGRIRSATRLPKSPGAVVVFEFVRVEYGGTRGVVSTSVRVWVKQRVMRRGYRISWTPRLPLPDAFAR